MGSEFRDMIARLCQPLPGAELTHPWDDNHDAWKVGGKMFAVIGAVDPGVSLKCQDIETAQMLIEAGVGTKAAYLHRSWIKLPETTAADEMRHRVHISYGIIRSTLTKKAQAALGPWPQES